MGTIGSGEDDAAQTIGSSAACDIHEEPISKLPLNGVVGASMIVDGVSDHVSSLPISTTAVAG